MIEPLVLKLLAEEPRHGYALIAAIHKNNGVLVGASILYPALKRLEQNKQVTSAWVIEDKPKRVYSLTAAGEKLLKEYTREFEIIVKPFVEVEIC